MQKDTNSQTNPAVDDQLQALLDKASHLAKEIDETDRDCNAKLDEIESKVNKSIAVVEKIYSDLDQIEKEAGDEIDRLILQQSETLAEA